MHSSSAAAIVVAFIALLAPAASGAGSAGCGQEPPSWWSPGDVMYYTQEWEGYSLQHRITAPTAYDKDTPSPLLLYYHGYTGDSSWCGSFCNTDAPEAGFIAVSHTGMGPSFVSSWSAVGADGEEGSEGITCEEDPDSDGTGSCGWFPECYPCSGKSQCGWATCGDSVGQALEILEMIQSSLCIDTTMVWATGCSNGAMMTFELARDPRTSTLLAGIAPMVGLPAAGHNDGPAAPGMSVFGMWGWQDWVIPPYNNVEGDPDKAASYGGPPNYWYSTSENTTDLWASANGCGTTKVSTTDWSLSDYPTVSCEAFTDCPGGVDVVECLFWTEGSGHVCQTDYQKYPILAFMLAHPRQVGLYSLLYEGAQCRGPTISSQRVDGVGECSVLCANEPTCAAFSVKLNSNGMWTCKLSRNCDRRRSNALWTTYEVNRGRRLHDLQPARVPGTLLV